MKQYASTILLFLVIALSIVSLYKITATFAPDFSIFYESAKDVLQHTYPYSDRTLFTQFNYPVATTLLFIPLTIFPHHLAQGIWITVSFLSVFVSVYLCIKLLKQKFSWQFFCIATSLALIAFPTKFTFGMGQTNLIAYTFLLGGFLAYQRKKLFITILLIVTAIILKPVLGLTLFIFLLQRAWMEFFLISAATGLVIVFSPVILHLPDANNMFLANIFSLQTTAGREVYYNQGVLGFISRLTTDFAIRDILNKIVAGFIIVVILIKSTKISFVHQLSLFLTCIVLLDPLSWQHHFVFLLLPSIATFFVIVKLPKHRNLYVTLLAIAYLLLFWNFKNPATLTSFPVSFLLSNDFYAAFILFALQLHLFSKGDYKAE